MKYKLFIVVLLLAASFLVSLYLKPQKEINQKNDLKGRDLNGWMPTMLKDPEGDCTVSLTKDGAVKAKFSQRKLPTITLALKSPYSTADVICSNEYCDENKKLPLILAGSSFSVPVIEASVKINNEKQFDYYSFMAKVPDNLISSPNYTKKIPLGLYAVYADVVQEKAIVDFISADNNVAGLYKSMCAD